MRRAAPLVLAVLAAGCRRPPEPFGSFTAFVPVVFRSNNPGRPPWAPKVTLTNTAAMPATVRLTRWPPDSPESEEQVLALAPGQTVSVPARLPLGSVSSLFFEGKSSFLVRADIVDRRRIAPRSPSRPAAEDLARPGDRLTLGPIVDTPVSAATSASRTRASARRRAVRVHLRLTPPGRTASLGRNVRSRACPRDRRPVEALSPSSGHSFDVEVAFLGRGAARSPGLWVYGSRRTVRPASRFRHTRRSRSPRRATTSIRGPLPRPSGEVGKRDDPPWRAREGSGARTNARTRPPARRADSGRRCRYRAP